MLTSITNLYYQSINMKLDFWFVFDALDSVFKYAAHVSDHLKKEVYSDIALVDLRVS